MEKMDTARLGWNLGPEVVPTFGMWEASRAGVALPGNPFLDDRLTLDLTGPDGGAWEITGFCDAEDGSVDRVRFMPLVAGTYRGTLTWAHGGETHSQAVSLTAVDGGAPGLVQAEGEAFVFSGSGEPFVWNSTTAYMLPGLREDLALVALDRLAAHGINRIRMSLSPSRQADGGRWFEPQVTEREDFTFRYSPWPDAAPESQAEPQFDPERFNVALWQKYERLVVAAGERGIQVQVVFFTDAQEPMNYPFDRALEGTDPNETRYFRYGVARLAAYANVEWCVTNEWALYRSDAWVEIRGVELASWDPYGHLLSVHGHGHFPFLASPWCTHALYQVWDEHGSAAWVHDRRADQAVAGVSKPIVNEEFGYEDHYALTWGEGRQPPSRDAASRVRQAWEIMMAGGWCTTGESAKPGAGGWINGLNYGESALLTGHRHLMEFTRALEPLRSKPELGRVSGHAMCRSIPGELYAVYVFGGGSSVLKLDAEAAYDVDAFDPRTGEWTPLVRGEVLIRDPYAGPGWVAPAVPYGETRAFLVRASGRA